MKLFDASGSRKLGLASAIVLVAISAARQASAEAIGINWQSGGEYGPYSVADEIPASAFGAPAAHWFQPQTQNGAGSLSVLGGEVDFSWSSSTWDGNLVGLPPQTAFGWAGANMGPGMTHLGPANGEAVILSKFIFATGAGEYGANSHPIVVTLSGLGSIARLSAGYTVTLVASSQTVVTGFTSGQASDNAGNNETIPLTLLAETPPYWPTGDFRSSGAVGSSTAGAFSGDTLTIVLEGFNETLAPNPYTRTTLSGVVIEFTPIPEPSTLALLAIGLIGAMGAARQRRS